MNQHLPHLLPAQFRQILAGNGSSRHGWDGFELCYRAFGDIPTGHRWSFRQRQRMEQRNCARIVVRCFHPGFQQGLNRFQFLPLNGSAQQCRSFPVQKTGRDASRLPLMPGPRFNDGLPARRMRLVLSQHARRQPAVTAGNIQFQRRVFVISRLPERIAPVIQ